METSSYNARGHFVELQTSFVKEHDWLPAKLLESAGSKTHWLDVDADSLRLAVSVLQGQISLEEAAASLRGPQTLLLQATLRALALTELSEKLLGVVEEKVKRRQGLELELENAKKEISEQKVKLAAAEARVKELSGTGEAASLGRRSWFSSSSFNDRLARLSSQSNGGCSQPRPFKDGHEVFGF